MTERGTRSVGPDGAHPVTPDGRYFVVRGRLWRCSDPRLLPAERERLVRALMDARRAVGRARRGDDPAARTAARAAVDAAKRALGERGPVWWDDGAPDYTRRLARNTPYAEWYAEWCADRAGAQAAAQSDRANRGRV